MKIYVRKLKEHDITHEVSVKKDIVRDFFASSKSFKIVGKNSKTEGIVTINDVTDPRFGNDFKKIIRDEGNAKEGDIIVMYKNNGFYTLEIITLENPKYQAIDELCQGDERHTTLIIENDLSEENRVKNGFNKIYYGVPGCGKSYIAHKDSMNMTKDDEFIVRTTFYPDYTNSDFLGQVIPKVDDNANSVIYDIQSGPFTEAMVKAIDNPSKYVCLIIEEINRGNAAAIFGDTFQLLDRNEFGESEYSIKNYIISKYLSKHCINQNYNFDSIKIPSNLILIGTMNTSDQNVFTLDTAFKRRWLMSYVSNNIDESKYANNLIPKLNVKWSDFVKEVNRLITNDDDTLGINGEDKQIGAYFISSLEWDKISEEINNNNIDEAARIFAEKVLSYLWEDVAKLNKSALFNGDFKTFEEVVNNFANNGKVLNIDFDQGNE